MDKKFLTYNLEEWIEDEQFIAWVLKKHRDKAWLSFISNNPEIKGKVKKARKIILLLRDTYDILEEEEVLNLWHNIEGFERLYRDQARKIKFRKTISIAASVLVVLSLGSILFLNSIRHEMEYSFSEVRTLPSENNAVLTLSNGDKIEVQQDKSQITVLGGENAVQINNDTVKTAVAKDVLEEEEMAMNELVVPYGKSTMVVLSDGTKVWLNAGSKFAFPQKFYGKKRKVFLDGEGYFEVAKNKKQPFIVSSQYLSVEVIGTKFNLSTYSSDGLCETVLLEGSVDVWNDNKLIKDKVRMVPNQKASYHVDEDQMEVKDEPEAENYIAWIEGWYKFSNESLEQVLTKVGRYYDVRFDYSEEKIVDALPVSGKLDLKDSFEEVMYTLSQVAEIEYKIEGEIVFIN